MLAGQGLRVLEAQRAANKDEEEITHRLSQPPRFPLRLQEDQDVVLADRALNIPHDGARRVVQELDPHLEKAHTVNGKLPTNATSKKKQSPSAALVPRPFELPGGGKRTWVTPPREPVRPRTRVTLAS